jgi:hypothetical protein
MDISVDSYRDLINEYKKLLAQWLRIRHNENLPQDIIDRLYSKLEAFGKRLDKYLPK